ncbi:DUF4836 family protein [Dysgonomonas sp. 521]|uniref:DUF4836 family protein n=1 Tax=Dysgonomonas sp. 521 TaxID=2302932 RepID=UPI0013D1BDA2|nr:DUF4836 family protein [Dysgonomonas sp. 521]NDV94739.1 DUF4836 family protein [Dysgonomonas sp. 521]
MKQARFILTIALLISFLYSCKDSADLTNAIPAGAVTVIHIDTKSLLTKADYKPLENKVIKDALNSAKNNGNSTKVLEQFEEFLKNPNSTGIDLVSDCYIYMDSITMGIVLKMNDAKKFSDLLTKTFEIPEQMLVEKDGITTIDIQRNVNIGWTKDKILLLTYSGYSYMLGTSALPDLDALLKKQLTQSEKESINAKKTFADFISNKKDVSIYYSYDNVFGMWATAVNPALSMYGGRDGKAVESIISGLQSQFKGVNMGAFISFDKGEVTLNNKMYYDSPEAEKNFADLASQLSGELKGDQLKYFAEKPVFAASANMNGEGVYNYLSQLGMIALIEKNAGSNLETMGIDLKSLISNINGDITVALNNVKTVKRKSAYSNYEYTDSYPELTFMADLKDANSTWDFIKGKVKEANGEFNVITEVNANTYSFSMYDGVTGYFGINNNMLFFTNRTDVLENLSAGDLKNEFSSQAKGNTAFIFGNLNPLQPMLLDEIGNDAKAQEFATKGLALIGDYSYASMPDMNGKGKIVITDTSGNSLAVICKFIDSVVTYAVQQNM